MKFIPFFATILLATPVLAEPVTFPEESIIINPSAVCKDLIFESNNSGYDIWRSYQYCIQYLRRFDEAVK